MDRSPPARPGLWTRAPPRRLGFASSPSVRNGPFGGEGECLSETLRAEALIEAILLPTGSQRLWGDLVTIVVSFRILHHFTSGVGGLHAGGHKTGWGSQVPGPSLPCQGSLEGHPIKGAGSDAT